MSKKDQAFKNSFDIYKREPLNVFALTVALFIVLSIVAVLSIIFPLFIIVLFPYLLLPFLFAYLIFLFKDNQEDEPQLKFSDFNRVFLLGLNPLFRKGLRPFISLLKALLVSLLALLGFSIIFNIFGHTLIPEINVALNQLAAFLETNFTIDQLVQFYGDRAEGLYPLVGGASLLSSGAVFIYLFIHISHRIPLILFGFELPIPNLDIELLYKETSNDMKKEYRGMMFQYGWPAFLAFTLIYFGVGIILMTFQLDVTLILMVAFLAAIFVFAILLPQRLSLGVQFFEQHVLYYYEKLRPDIIVFLKSIDQNDQIDPHLKNKFKQMLDKRGFKYQEEEVEEEKNL